MLLCALQRLKLEQWGLNPYLDARVDQAHFGTFERSRARQILEPAVTFATISGKKLGLTRGVCRSGLGVIGRGVVATGAELQHGPPDILYAAKVSWPEQTRPNEAEVLQEAMKSAQGNTDITNHIPTVFATQDFLYCTENVRKALGTPESMDGHPDPRVLRHIVFPYLRPILKGARRFLYSWLERVRCVLPELPQARPYLNHLRISLGHFKLWKLGFEHRDPSLGILMVNPTTGRGVLNDWDLSHHPGLPRSVQNHGERTGTVPFVAIDLLCARNWRGRKPRLYRHDLEGFYRGCSSSMSGQHSKR